MRAKRKLYSLALHQDYIGTYVCDIDGRNTYRGKMTTCLLSSITILKAENSKVLYFDLSIHFEPSIAMSTGSNERYPNLSIHIKDKEKNSSSITTYSVYSYKQGIPYWLNPQ